jgi:prepilin peptidase CpaA
MTAFFVAAVLVAAVAAWVDWKTGEIPNWLTLGALALAPLAHLSHARAIGATMEESAIEGGASIAGAIVTALVPLLLYRQNAMGGGDVKLYAALGAILHPSIGIEAAMYSFIAAALLAPIRLIYEGKFLNSMKNAATIGANLFRPTKKQTEVDESSLTWFRLGPAIFLGTLAAVLLRWRAVR